MTLTLEEKLEESKRIQHVRDILENCRDARIDDQDLYPRLTECIGTLYYSKKFIDTAKEKTDLSKTCSNCGNEGSDCVRCSNSFDDYWIPETIKEPS